MTDLRSPVPDDSGTAGPLPQAQRAITELMNTLDRTDPLWEAEFAALETALALLRAASAHEDQRMETLGMLREALGSARATVIATGFALTRTGDLNRARSAASRQTATERPQRTRSPSNRTP